MGKLLTYAATAAVALIASPFVLAAVLLVLALAVFIGAAVVGVITVTLTLLIPIIVTAGVGALAAWALFKLLD